VKWLDKNQGSIDNLRLYGRAAPRASMKQYGAGRVVVVGRRLAEQLRRQTALGSGACCFDPANLVEHGTDKNIEQMRCRRFKSFAVHVLISNAASNTFATWIALRCEPSAIW
jgi:hypothetical protein